MSVADRVAKIQRELKLTHTGTFSLLRVAGGKQPKGGTGRVKLVTDGFLLATPSVHANGCTYTTFALSDKGRDAVKRLRDAGL